MATGFGIPHIVDYLDQMGVKIAHIDHERKTVELAFRGEDENWKMIIGIQHNGDVSKLMLMVPYIYKIGAQKRLECLEALMAVNYHIALGKFGLDLEDGEVRLEECIPLASQIVSFEQFRLAFNAILQTTLIYRSLFSHIITGNMPAQDALRACEQNFFQTAEARQVTSVGEEAAHSLDAQGVKPKVIEEPLVDLNVDDVLAEVKRLLQGNLE